MTTVFLDRGHEDSGDRGASGVIGGIVHDEVAITTPVWNAVPFCYAAPSVVQVVPTGSFATRAKTHAGKPGVWISLHCNSAPANPSSRGLRLFYNKANAKIAKVVDRAMAFAPSELFVAGRKADGIEKNDAGYPRAASYVFRFDQPVIIVEFGYLSNQSDLKFLTSKEGQDKMILFTSMLCWEAATVKL